MAAFGHDAVTIDEQEVEVGAGRYLGRDFTVEPDASSASYPLAAAAICGGRVQVPGLTETSLQGDAEFCDVLETMGCTAMRDDLSTVVERSGGLHGIDIDMVDLSDLVPTLAAVAVFADSPPHPRRRVHPHQGERPPGRSVHRAAAPRSRRRRDRRRPRSCRAATARSDAGNASRPSAGDGFGLIGLRVGGVQIDDPDVVSKSWPGFWDMLGGLR